MLEVVGRHLTDPQLLSLSVGELESCASLVLGQGSPLLMGGLRPVPPNLVYCGMMQCRPARPLPADLQDLMDAATQGVVLVSFGSVLQGSQVINILYTSCTHLQLILYTSCTHLVLIFYASCTHLELILYSPSPGPRGAEGCTPLCFGTAEGEGSDEVGVGRDGGKA